MHKLRANEINYVGTEWLKNFVGKSHIPGDVKPQNERRGIRL